MTFWFILNKDDKEIKKHIQAFEFIEMFVMVTKWFTLVNI